MQFENYEAISARVDYLAGLITDIQTQITGINVAISNLQADFHDHSSDIAEVVISVSKLQTDYSFLLEEINLGGVLHATGSK